MKTWPFLLFLLAAVAHAGTRQSMDYLVTTDAIDSGGGRSTSTDYANNGSLGLTTGVSGSTSPVETNKAGYIAQLYDVTGLSISGPTNPATVVSGGTVQLMANQILDDASLLAVPASAVAWSVAGGPLASISTSGLATAGTVSFNQTATARGSFGGFSGNLSVSVIGQTQTITFPAIGTHSVGDGQFQLQATSSSGATVTYAVIGGNATISGNLLTVTGPGPVTVQASAGGTNYVPAEYLQTFQVVDTSARFQGLGDLPGGGVFSSAYGVANGGIQVAEAVDDGAVEAAVWTVDYQGLHVRNLGNGSAGVSAAAFGISADGSTLVGTGNSGGYEPFVYTIPNTPNGTASPFYLGNVNGYLSGAARAVSGDGSVVVGFSSSNSVPGSGVAGSQAFRWTQHDGLEPLGVLSGGSGSRADGISADGSVIVGTSSTDIGPREAFLYTSASGLQGLGAFSGGGFSSSALGISADGTVVVGNSVNPTHQQACFWHLTDTSPTALPETAGATESSAESVCGDGTIAVGYQTLNGTRQATIWENGHAQSLQTLLSSAPYNLTAALSNWTLTEATSISPDGFAIAGIGVHAGATEGWLVILPRTAVFSFAAPAYTINEGAPSVTLIINKTVGLRASVGVNLIAGTAVPVSNGVGDYFIPTTASLAFDTQQTSGSFAIALNKNLAPAPNGSRSFNASLVSPGGGATVSTTASAAAVTISGNTSADPHGPPTPQIDPDSPPAPGALTVTLQNNVPPTGNPLRWRLLGESAWRDSGDTVPGLAAGEYAIEFEGIADFTKNPPVIVAAPAPVGAVIVSGMTSPVTIAYPPSTVDASQTGSLEVFIAPKSLAQNPAPEQRGRWRFASPGNNNPWMDGGATILGLPPGSYALEFQRVNGQVPIRNRDIAVDPGAPTTIEVDYLTQETVTGNLPKTLLPTQVIGQSPYEFLGKITSDLGEGSGTVVGGRVAGATQQVDRVVLTAAHVVFDDTSAAFATGTQWLFQKLGTTQEPTPLLPRGAILDSGYAAARKGATLDEGNAASQELDAAALYFFEPAGNRGASGYLVSDSTGFDWLQQPRLKTLAGYAVEDDVHVQAADAGSLQATDKQLVTFSTTLDADVLATTQIAGLPGMSGGPLCVQYDDGRYYPAGIYLGGARECLVRQIDTKVDQLIQAAAYAAANNGPNHLSGGQVAAVSGLVGDLFAPTSVKINFVGTSPSDASWRFASQPTSVKNVGGAPVLSGTGYQTIVFNKSAQSLSNALFVPPANYTVKLSTSEQLVLDAEYTLIKAPEITTGGLPLGGYAGLDQTYFAQIVAQNAPAGFSGSIQPVAGGAAKPLDGSNPLKLGIDKLGRLTGHIPPDSSLAGEYLISLSASNLAGKSNSRSYQLFIAPTGTLSVQYDTANGVVTPSLSSQVPIGAPITLTASAKTSAYLFDGWSELTTDAGGNAIAQPLSAKAALVFVMPASLTLSASFIRNPYPTLAGVYTGLLTAPADLKAAPAATVLQNAAAGLAARGLLNATVTRSGSISGNFYLGPVPYTFHGQLDNRGSFAAIVKGPTGQPPVTVNLHLADYTALEGAPPGQSSALTYGLTGTLTTTPGSAGSGATFALSATRPPFTAHAPAPQALGQSLRAKYVVALPHAAGAEPAGDGFATVSVTPLGTVLLSGTLGDGTTVSQSSALGPKGEWPVFIVPSAYHGAGVITGLLNIDSAGILSGQLDWFKKPDAASVKSLYYPGGFAFAGALGNAVAVRGEPLTATPLAGAGPLALAVSGGGIANLSGSFKLAINSATGLQAGASSPTGLTGFGIAPSSGLFKGQFLDSARKPHPFNGVLIPANGANPATGFGLFKGDAGSQQTGAVEF